MKLNFLIVLSLGFSLWANSAEIKLEDLGYSEKSVVNTQAPTDPRMEERRSQLKTHEKLGLITLGAMTATMLTGGSAVDSDVHMYLGITSGLLYFTTAYYSLSAYKPSHIKDRGSIKWHKRLAWIHFPAMVLAPVLGYIYKKNEENDKKSSSLVKQHPTIAGVGFGAFALSAAIMTFEF